MIAVIRSGRGSTPRASPIIRVVPARDTRVHLHREQRHLHTSPPPAAYLKQVPMFDCLVVLLESYHDRICICHRKSVSYAIIYDASEMCIMHRITEKCMK